MGQEQFSGPALMNIHLDIPINIDESINDFLQKRMQLENTSMMLVEDDHIIIIILFV